MLRADSGVMVPPMSLRGAQRRSNLGETAHSGRDCFALLAMTTKENEMAQAARFRQLMRRDGMVVAPGAYDCITARLIERAGFDCVYMTGAGTAARFGYPDFGLVTMSGMVMNAGQIAAAVDLPVIADADTGYGNELNVVRTVREYEK